MYSYSKAISGKERISLSLLMAEDPEFRAICEDYDDCVHAWQYWAKSKEPEAETRVNEYRTLIKELENEITQALTAVESQHQD